MLRLYSAYQENSRPMATNSFVYGPVLIPDIHASRSATDIHKLQALL